MYSIASELLPLVFCQCLQVSVEKLGGKERELCLDTGDA